MPVYLIVGPAAALIGIVAVFFVMRHRSVQTRSMYSSRRSQIERKVRSARQRTLAPRGRSAPTASEIAAAVPAPSAPAYSAPAAPKQAWEMPASPAPAYAPPPPAPEYASPPPAAPEYSPPATPPPAPPYAEPSVPVGAEPEWTPAPAQPEWTPAPAPAPDMSPAPEPAAAVEPLTPAGGGAAWSIVGDVLPGTDNIAAQPDKKAGKGKKAKSQEGGGGAAWQLASGEPAVEGEDDEEVFKKPSAAMAIAQYAVLVVGLVMVLIGVLVMVANSKVT